MFYRTHLHIVSCFLLPPWNFEFIKTIYDKRSEYYFYKFPNCIWDKVIDLCVGRRFWVPLRQLRPVVTHGWSRKHLGVISFRGMSLPRCLLCRFGYKHAETPMETAVPGNTPAKIVRQITSISGEYARLPGVSTTSAFLHLSGAVASHPASSLRGKFMQQK